MLLQIARKATQTSCKKFFGVLMSRAVSHFSAEHRISDFSAKKLTGRLPMLNVARQQY
jgi:hypothetical protein